MMENIRAAGVHVYNFLFDVYHATVACFRSWCVCICPERNFRPQVSMLKREGLLDEIIIQERDIDARLAPKLVKDAAVYHSFSSSLSRINAEFEGIYKNSRSRMALFLLLPANQRRLFLIPSDDIKEFDLKEVGDVEYITCLPTQFCFSSQLVDVWLQLIDKNENGYLVVAQRANDIKWFPERANLAFREDDFVKDDDDFVTRSEALKGLPSGKDMYVTTRHYKVDEIKSDNFLNFPRFMDIHSDKNPDYSGLVRALAMLPDGRTVMLYSINTGKKKPSTS